MSGPLTAKVLTVSDGVVAGTREDRSGRALADRLAAAGFTALNFVLVPLLGLKEGAHADPVLLAR